MLEMKGKVTITPGDFKQYLKDRHPFLGSRDIFIGTPEVDRSGNIVVKFDTENTVGDGENWFDPEIVGIEHDEGRVPAIRRLMEITGWRLEESKEYVEMLVGAY